MHDKDSLIQGYKEKNSDLDSVAVAEQPARTSQKQKETQKKTETPWKAYTDSDTDLDPKNRSQLGGKGSGFKGLESGSKGR